MKANYHTHTRWCDGANTPDEMAEAALARGFVTLGFSSHAMFPLKEDHTLDPARALDYVRDIRRVATDFSGRLRVLCGLEADFIPGVTTPDRARYAALGLDYLIGSVHYVVAPDGATVPVDHTPEILFAGIRDHFDGDAKALIRGYHAALRAMVATCDFDIVGHPDLYRKFNVRHPFFSEDEAWYRDELVRSAEALAASGKIVEVNTGAMGRGWFDDAYPSAPFRDLLRARGVRFVLNSDCHATTQLDAGFDRFETAEAWVAPWASL